MTLEEVIEYLEKMIEIDKIYEVSSGAEENRQLAEWLKELKAYRKKLNCTDCIIDGTDACSRGAGKAVDDEICGDFMSSCSEIPNTCGDAISREAAVNAIYDLCGENVSLKENPFRDNPHMDAVIDELENLPSVSPQQKVGRWIETQEPNDVEPFKLWECSRCEQRQRRKSNYCPNCGAKMVEPQESEEQMTREEAIKGLTSLVEVRRKYCDMQTMKDEIQCLEMAIQALKQEQTRDEKMIDAIDFAIKATNSQDDYSMGMRNGMRYVKSLINGKEPQYELRQTDEEIKLGIDIGDEVVNKWGAKGVVIGIDTSYEGEVLLSLLMRNHKVPQLVVASSYKTKTGRHFPQIIEVLEQIKGESDGK